MIALTCASVALSHGAPARASEGAKLIPYASQVAIFLKILSFDRSVETRSDGDVTIAIVTAPEKPAAAAAAREILSHILPYNGQSIRGRTLRISERSIREILAVNDGSISVLILPPGTEASLPKVLEWSARNGAVTFGTTPAMGRQGVSISLDGDAARPRIVINLVQIKAERRDLDARVLALASVKK